MGTELCPQDSEHVQVGNQEGLEQPAMSSVAMCTRPNCAVRPNQSVEERAGGTSIPLAGLASIVARAGTIGCETNPTPISAACGRISQEGFCSKSLCEFGGDDGGYSAGTRHRTDADRRQVQRLVDLSSRPGRWCPRCLGGCTLDPRLMSNLFPSRARGLSTPSR